MSIHKDVLIIGQGLAGTTLAFALHQAGHHCDIIDDGHLTASSRVGIAVINPVTGRRYAKSWNIDTLMPTASEAYARIGTLLGRVYLHPAQIWQSLADTRVEENWMLRATDPAFSPYLGTEISTLSVAGIRPLRVAQIFKAAHLHVNALLEDARAWFAKHEMLVTGEMDMHDLQIGTDHITYAGKTYRYIVFCEGHRAIKNRFFDHLEIYPMKGEYLLCHIPELEGHVHIKSGVSLIPMPDQDLYWVGATYERYVLDPRPTTAGQRFLTTQLEHIIDVPYTITHHGAGIRATTRDRRPYVGGYHLHPHVLTISGLGTKGASLAPFCADILVGAMFRDTPIPHEVDIFRHIAR